MTNLADLPPAATVTPTMAMYTALQQAYDHFNRELFGGQLPPCMITLQRNDRTYGYFSAGRFGNRDKGAGGAHEIAINPAYFAVTPLLETLQTIVHEMAHLWQYEFGKPSRSGYHNSEWAKKMEDIGLMPSTTGQVGGAKTGQNMMDYAIPEGMFLAACKSLLLTEWKLTYYDKITGPRPLAALESWTANPNPLSLDMPTIALAVPAIEGAPTIPKPLTPVNRSNRSKYNCRCDKPNSVWGRPGLKLRCEDCEQLFDEEP